jgi:hypothetical protein
MHAGSRVDRFAVPAPTQDYALAQIDVRASAAMHYELRVRGARGADYIAAAAIRAPAKGLRILVFVLGRTTAAMMPAEIDLALRLPRSTDKPSMLLVKDGLAARQRPRTAFCDLQAGSTPLAPQDLGGPSEGRGPVSVGTPLSNLSPADILTQGYDYSCGLPHLAGFAEAVRGASSPTPEPPEPTPIPEPTPTPTPCPCCPVCTGSICPACAPAPGGPCTRCGCPPCQPGHICPLAAQPAIICPEKTT